MAALIDDKIAAPANNRLIDQMLREGKKRYAISQLIPFAADTVLHETTPAQLQWLKENELEIWSFFAAEKKLYSTNQRENMKYTNPAPYSPGMPDEAPGNVGTWLGYRIVCAYLRRHPDTRLADLLQLNNSDLLLREAQYKPKK